MAAGVEIELVDVAQPIGVRPEARVFREVPAPNVLEQVFGHLLD